MKKHLMILMSLFSAVSLFSQVGINTSNPKAILHVDPLSFSTSSGKDGILIPRIENFPGINPERLGQLVFLKDNTTLKSGFYYWDATNWIPFPDSVERAEDETIYVFDGLDYTGTDLTRTMNFSKYKKAKRDGFSILNNEISVGKSGLYLISLTGNTKKPSGSQDQANFSYSVYINNALSNSVNTSIAAESTSSTSATISFLKRLKVGDKLKATITKTDQGPNNYVAFGINNLTLFFIQD
ncbi:hypothetical protein [Empedobacter brevis]|uniref:hypothetical protein n=1 Tax=Empedobacter brevis TaxID=247 RepID=UPI0028CFE0AF|nr:hypothetical protein [Empedobacter brevis]